MLVMLTIQDLTEEHNPKIRIHRALRETKKFLHN
jgi:hypothetical protein